jgi:clan AA aspartic protease (TIGR02281 family)
MIPWSVRCRLALLVVAAVALPLSVMAGDDPAVAEGMAQLERQEYSRAVRSFEAAIARGNGSAKVYDGLGRAWLRLGANRWGNNLSQVAKAVEALRRAKELDPADAAVRLDLGMALLANGDRQGAEEELARLQELDGELAARLSAAVAGYESPTSYRSVGEEGRSDGSVTPVKIVGNTVFVPVTLSHGYRTAQVQLILDTGASVTTITPDIASRLDMRLDQAVSASIQVVGGGEVEAHGVRLERVDVGPHVKSGMNVAVIDNKGSRLQYDGLLGMDFLRGLHYRLDFNEKVIRWMP